MSACVRRVSVTAVSFASPAVHNSLTTVHVHVVHGFEVTICVHVYIKYICIYIYIYTCMNVFCCPGMLQQMCVHGCKWMHTQYNTEQNGYNTEQNGYNTEQNGVSL